MHSIKNIRQKEVSPHTKNEETFELDVKSEVSNTNNVASVCPSQVASETQTYPQTQIVPSTDIVIKTTNENINTDNDVKICHQPISTTVQSIIYKKFYTPEDNDIPNNNTNK